MVVLLAMPSQTRQLAAIMFTDIVGYTALMGKDSAKALDLVRISKEIQKPLVEKHNGKWIKEMGDGAMAQFGSALDAVNCALEIQRTSRADFEGDLRIGIHLGDITLEENDVYGDGVNVAARLESISDPGGIYISESIEKAIRGQSDIQAKYLGVVLLKNVDYGVRTYAIQGDLLPVPSKHKIKELSGSQTNWKRLFKSAFAYFFVICLLIAAGWWIWQSSKADELHEIRSLAILPFDDLSGNKDQEFLVDGLQDNLITTISKMSSIRITSRTSTKQYKNTDMSVPEIAKELGVDAIIEASLLKFEAVVQLNVQLVKAFPEEQHLWQDIFERPAGDIQYLFEDVAQTISNEVSSALSENNPSLSSTAKEINPEAYKAYMNGKFLAENAPTNETLERALKYFQRSIELDSTYAPAYAGISWVWISLHQMHSVPGAEAIPKIYAYNSKAIELDPDYADA
jgi:class 3 adenylate cyclase/TolB-like protein